MRLIDADALRKEHCDGCPADIREGCKTDPVCASLMWVHEAPTIDAVPVVRCKDCVWHHRFGCAFDTRHPDDVPKDDDFCSCGERRNDD